MHDGIFHEGETPEVQTQVDEDARRRINDGQEVELEGVDQYGNEVLVYVEPTDE